MTGHPIFERFTATPSTTSGQHIYDFLGSATRVAFKRGWAQHAVAAGRTITPAEPPKNEHYLDWIALLTAVERAHGTFRMAELGAGWAPWLVRGALAARQTPDVTEIELLAVEADPTHHAWIADHFRDNGLEPGMHHILHGAASAQQGTLRFPVIEDPDVDYGASLNGAARAGATIEVKAWTLAELLALFSGPVDFLHVDIQGAEYDVLPPAMGLLSAKVKSIMVGTHVSDAAHDGLVEAFRQAGWKEVINLARNRSHQTPWGEIKVGDGFLLFENSQLT